MELKSTTKSGLFITFEGLDGSGKTTQLRLAADFLRQEGRTVSSFREPGATLVGEKLREILLDNGTKLGKITELLLYEAARAELVAREIRPRLNRGEIVLCDRFYDSTTAYQGYGRELDIGDILKLNAIAAASLVPDLTLLYDLPLASAKSRREPQLDLLFEGTVINRTALRDIGDEPDRLESQSSKFFERVAKGFRQIALAEPHRVKRIDATPSIEVVFSHTKRHIQSILG